MKRKVLVVLALFPALSAFAGISQKTRAEMKSRSDFYFLLVANGERLNEEAGECHPSPKACVEYVAGSFSSTEDRISAARACAGNYGDACAKWAAGSFAQLSDRLAAAKACRDNRTLDCAVYVAGSFANLGDRLSSAAACAGADVECVKYVAGNFASLEQRIAAAKSCSVRD